MQTNAELYSSPRPALRIGVVGLGRAFTLMLPTFAADARVELVAACDPREAARSQFARDFGRPAYENVEQLAADPTVEVVYVASPNSLHAQHTGIAAAQGKHVLLEKPMALTLAECDSMVGACTHAGVRLVVGHCHSFDTPYLKARELIASGDLGRVRMIQALNYTDHVYRPRRPDELSTASGGGVVFSQAAHQVDVVRLLAGSRALRVRCSTGRWDAARPIEGAYSAMLWFECGAFASLVYSGYGHFDSDEWCGGVGEMGMPKHVDTHAQTRRRLAALADPSAEARLKAARTYGGDQHRPVLHDAAPVLHQHFGPVIVACERGDVRPLPDAVWVYGDTERRRHALDAPTVPRFEVIDELVAAVRVGIAPLHDGAWARATLQICLAMLESARTQRDVELA
ncbi:MAG: Gfo/Idh/MocA family oxidoreductase [Burkholderiaceae bacterium]